MRIKGTWRGRAGGYGIPEPRSCRGDGKGFGISLECLRVDGGMVTNDLLMQFQADILNRDVMRPVIQETTALGAAYAAGLAVKFFSGLEELRANWAVDHTWKPHAEELERETLYREWKKAVTRSSIGLMLERKNR